LDQTITDWTSSVEEPVPNSAHSADNTLLDAQNSVEPLALPDTGEKGANTAISVLLGTSLLGLAGLLALKSKKDQEN